MSEKTAAVLPTVVGVVLILFALAIGAAVVVNGRHGLLLAPAVVLAFLGSVVVIPSWRKSASEGIWFNIPGGGGGFGDVGSSDADTEVERPVSEEAANEQLEELAEEVEARQRNLLSDLVQAQEPDDVWLLVRQAMEAKEHQRARALCDAALDEYGDHPKFLITSGYLWRRQEDMGRAIRDQERAIQAAEGDDEFREQYYVASTNIAFYLAEQKNHPDRALEAGERAAEVADEFENRDSFCINYGFAQLRFACDKQELVAALRYLLDLHERDLSPAEIREVNRYLEQGLEQLEAQAD